MRIPSPQLVAVSFLKTQATDEFGVSSNLPALQIQDARSLPADNWGGKRIWVTVSAVGTSLTRPVPVRSPFVTVTVWCKPFDKRRHWGSAEAVAQELIELGTDWTTNLHLNMLQPNYRSVILSDFQPVSDVRRIPNDPQDLARVEFDALLTYNIATSN